MKKKFFFRKNGNTYLPDQKTLDLLKRIREGDSKAQEEIISMFKLKIEKAVTFRLRKSKRDCADLIHDIWVAVLESLRKGKYDPKKGKSLQSYVFGIINNQILYYFKSNRNKPQSGQELSFRADPRVNIESEVETSDSRENIIHAIHRLPRQYQEILFLRFYQELGIPDISEQLGIPRRRVSERIHYAITMLKKVYPKK